MLSKTFLPSAALRRIAKSYHIRHFVLHDITMPAFKPYPARPEQSIVFYPREYEVVEYVQSQKRVKRAHVSIINQYTIRTNRHTTNDFLAIIVELHPGVLHRLTGAPLNTFLNTDLDAESIFSSEIKHVSSRLNSTDDYAVMIEIIEMFLVHLSRKFITCEHAVDKVANFVLRQNCNVSVDWLADQACLGVRQLERKFKERIGCNPKTYFRLSRMHESYKLKTLHPYHDWLFIALSCGYHDYQHLVKDYRDFAGCNPNELFSEQVFAPEHIVGLQETFD